MKNIEKILEYKKTELGIYSPFGFLRDADKISLTKETVIDPVIKGIHTGDYKIFDIIVNREIHYFIAKKLEWDTGYFGFPVYNIHLILFNHGDWGILNSAIEAFAKKHIQKGAYWFLNVPSDDILMVQALCSTRFRLVETRLNYYLSDIQSYKADHYPTRLANTEDIQELSRVASAAC